MRQGWLLILISGCDCLVQGSELSGTITSTVQPRVWVCAEAPPEGRDGDRFRQCVEGDVTGAAETWTYTATHSPGPGGGPTCYRISVVVFEAEGCERQVVDLADVSSSDTGAAGLDVTLDC